jgi:predicted dinucleotide-binding enzyme
VRWADLKTALGGLPAWSGRIVIDATNPVEFLAPDSPGRKDPDNPLAAYGLKTVDLGGKVSTRVVGGSVPGARIVKAFNHLPVNLLPEPAASGGKRVLFYSGDDAGAKDEVRKLIDRTGAFPIDLGSLDVGAPLASLPFGPLAGISLIKA